MTIRVKVHKINWTLMIYSVEMLLARVPQLADHGQNAEPVTSISLD